MTGGSARSERVQMRNGRGAGGGDGKGGDGVGGEPNVREENAK